jgi:hypothetical protein
MENLEQKCLEKLNKILSKFDLKIEIINIQSNFLEYLLVDNSMSEIDWLGPWLSISHILVSSYSIFDCLKKYYDTVNSSSFSYIHFSDSQLSKFQRYSKVYQSIQHLKSCYLEEFIFKCDLMGV